MNVMNYQIDPNVTDAIKKLLEITEIESDGIRSGQLMRKMALNKWLSEYLVEVSAEQRVISTKHLDSETKDLLKYHLANLLAEELHDRDAVITKCEEKRIETRVFALRRN